MATYNLINSSNITSNIIDGNKELSYEELLLLYNSNTSSSGIALTAVDVLYIDIDLNDRYLVGDFNLYIDVPGDRATALTSVDFYYKEEYNDSFTLCAKEYDATTFYPIGLPELFAPRQVRIVIDGVESDVFEIALISEDSTVAFGDDGNQSLKVIDEGYIGYDTLKIYNNSAAGTFPANAYIVINYSGEEDDSYVYISDSAEGEYISVSGTPTIGGDPNTALYRLNQGTYYETVDEGNSVMIDPYDNVTEGEYYTPVVTLGDPLASSFLLTNYSTCSGTNVTYSINPVVKTARTRSGTDTPLSFNRVFWISKRSDNTNGHILEGDLNDTEYVGSRYVIPSVSNVNAVIFNKFNNHVYLVNYYSGWYMQAYEYGHDNLNLTYSLSGNSYYAYKEFLFSDAAGNIWLYNSSSGFHIRILPYDLSTSTTLLTSPDSDFVEGMSVAHDTLTCWYTDSDSNSLRHINTEGEILNTISLGNPKHVSANPDGSVWVNDANDSTLKLYSFVGEEVRQVRYTAIPDELKDFKHYGDHLWCLSSTNTVYKIDYNGNILADISIGAAETLTAFDGGCLVNCPDAYLTYQINNEGKSANVWDLTDPFTGTLSMRAFTVSYTYEEQLDYPHRQGSLLPLPKDPVWGRDTTSNWTEVPIDGNILPFAQYHQFGYKLHGTILTGGLQNGDFESGNMDHWVLSNASMDVQTDNPRSGTYSGGMSVGGSWSSFNMYQKIDLSTIPGYNFDDADQGFYRGVFYGYMWPFGTCYVYLYLEFYDEYDVAIDGAIFYTQTNYTQTGIYYQTWKRYLVDAIIWPGTRYVKCYVHCDGVSSNTGNFYSDDWKFDVLISPKVNTISVPKPVIIKNIPPGQSKDLYIKTKYPANTAKKQINSELKCWWGNEEI